MDLLKFLNLRLSSQVIRLLRARLRRGSTTAEGLKEELANLRLKATRVTNLERANQSLQHVIASHEEEKSRLESEVRNGKSIVTAVELDKRKMRLEMRRLEEGLKLMRFAAAAKETTATNVKQPTKDVVIVKKPLLKLPGSRPASSSNSLYPTPTILKYFWRNSGSNCS